MKVRELVNLQGCYSAHDVGELEIPVKEIVRKAVWEGKIRLNINRLKEKIMTWAQEDECAD